MHRILLCLVNCSIVLFIYFEIEKKKNRSCPSLQIEVGQHLIHHVGLPKLEEQLMWMNLSSNGRYGFIRAFTTVELKSYNAILAPPIY